MKCPEQTNPNTESRLVVARDWGTGNWEKEEFFWR